jgi:hypothetical protein
MSLSTHKTAPEMGVEENGNGKVIFTAQETQTGDMRQAGEDDLDISSVEELAVLERKLVRKIDLRLCTIAGILCRYVYPISSTIANNMILTRFWKV